MLNKFYYFFYFILLILTINCNEINNLNNEISNSVENDCYIEDGDFNTYCKCDGGCKCGTQNYLVKRNYYCPILPINCETKQTIILLTNDYECPCVNNRTECLCDYGMKFNTETNKCECDNGFIDDGNRCKCDNDDGCDCKLGIKVEKGIKCHEYNGVCDDGIYTLTTDAAICPCKTSVGKCFCDGIEFCQCTGLLNVKKGNYCPYGDINDRTCDSDMYLFDPDEKCPCKKGDGTCYCESNDGCICSEDISSTFHNYCPVNGICKNDIYINNNETECICNDEKHCKFECDEGVYTTKDTKCPTSDGYCEDNGIYNIIEYTDCPCKSGNGKCKCDSKDFCKCGNSVIVNKGEICPYGDEEDKTCDNNIDLYNPMYNCPCKHGDFTCKCKTEGCYCSKDVIVSYENLCPYPNGECQNDVYSDNKDTQCTCNNNDYCKYKCSEGVYTNKDTQCPTSDGYCENNGIYNIINEDIMCPCNSGNGKCKCDIMSGNNCLCSENVYANKGNYCPYGNERNKYCDNVIVLSDSFTNCPCKNGDGYCYCTSPSGCNCTDGIKTNYFKACPKPNGYCENTVYITNINSNCPCKTGNGSCMCKLESCNCKNGIAVKTDKVCPGDDKLCYNEVYITDETETVKCPCNDITQCKCKEGFILNNDQICEKIATIPPPTTITPTTTIKPTQPTQIPTIIPTTIEPTEKPENKTLTNLIVGISIAGTILVVILIIIGFIINKKLKKEKENRLPFTQLE